MVGGVKVWAGLASAVAAIGLGTALAQAPAPSPAPAAGQETFPGRPPPHDAFGKVKGYLGERPAPDASQFLSGPPPAGSQQQLSDEAIFQTTRPLAHAPRGRLAAADADLKLPGASHAFDCAAGVRLEASPTLMRMMVRVEADAGRVYNKGKEAWRRPRPFVGREATVETCVAPADRPGGYSYPSGHSTLGWAWALVLSELEPDRASEILDRGRTFGESRIVCGVHYDSDVQAGRLSGSALFAALSGDREFQADLARVRKELAKARASHALPSPSQCQAEHDALSTPIYR